MAIAADRGVAVCPVASRSREGFTLFELMVVIIIIAVVAALALPAVGNALRDRKASGASLEAVRLARRARSEAAAYGRAHLIRFTETTMGRVELWRGLNNGCNTNDWATLMGGGCDGNTFCLEALDLDQSPYTTPGSRIEMRAPDLGNFVDVCYDPAGVMGWRVADTARFLERNAASAGSPSLSGGVRFRFTPQRNDGTTTGPVRWVLLPLGGDARTLR